MRQAATRLSRRRRVAGAAAALILAAGSIPVQARAGTPGQAAGRVTINDNQAYASGAYLAYIAPFNKGSLVYGTDYTESISFPQALFPRQITFAWSWPQTPCPDSVYDFSAVDYGDYYNTVVPAPVTPRQVGALLALKETHNASFAGELQNYDVIDDMFLTTRPGDDTTHAAEIEVFLHTPGYAASFVQGSTQLGTFTGSGITWTVAIYTGAIPDILFMPSNQADVPRGTIDIRAMLARLVSQGVIAPTLYINGFAFGTETRQGSGSVRLNSLSATLQ